MFDLLLGGGCVIDPAQGIDAVLDVASADGEVAEPGENSPGGTPRAEPMLAWRNVVPGGHWWRDGGVGHVEPKASQA